jgi:hypothetical protein
VMTDQQRTKKSNDKSERSCWHCRFYIRPSETLVIDGPVTSVCIIDRDKSVYPNTMYLTPGDVSRQPDETCDRFEMDRPPYKQ